MPLDGYADYELQTAITAYFQQARTERQHLEYWNAQLNRQGYVVRALPTYDAIPLTRIAVVGIGHNSRGRS